MAVRGDAVETKEPKRFNERFPCFTNLDFEHCLRVWITCCMRLYIWGFIRKTRPFNHIFGGDRILRA